MIATWVATVRVEAVLVSSRILPREAVAVRLETGERDTPWTFDVSHVRRDDDGREWIALHAVDHSDQSVGRLVVTTALTGSEDAMTLEVLPPHTLEVPATETTPCISVTIAVEEPN